MSSKTTPTVPTPTVPTTTFTTNATSQRKLKLTHLAAASAVRALHTARLARINDIHTRLIRVTPPLLKFARTVSTLHLPDEELDAAINSLTKIRVSCDKICHWSARGVGPTTGEINALECGVEYMEVFVYREREARRIAKRARLVRKIKRAERRLVRMKEKEARERAKEKSEGKEE